MLLSRQRNEDLYQKFFVAHPWIFGAQYKQIVSHDAFNDENIPDFTGVRVRDAARDIIEIKSPSLSLVQRNGELRAEFNKAWNQAERYLDFARSHSDYLYREKGLRFENPICYLIAGYNLSDEHLRAVRRKERLNPAITLLTYNDVLALGKATVELINNLRN